MRKIILASNSPRRQELLRILVGNNFIIKKSSYEENNKLSMPPMDLVIHHSREKGQNVAQFFENGVVISSDTLVVFENEVLGKPETEENAEMMLNKISGHWIDVISGIYVIDIENKKEFKDYEITRVKIKIMDEEEILNYIKTGEPLDRAGAFAIQGKGAVLVEKIDGCYFNVVGLPLFKLNKILKIIGINIFGL